MKLAQLSFISPQSRDAESTKSGLSSHPPLRAAGNAQYAPCTPSMISLPSLPCLLTYVLHFVVTSLLCWVLLGNAAGLKPVSLKG